MISWRCPERLHVASEMEDAVKPIVLAALADEAVQKEMSKCLDDSQQMFQRWRVCRPM